MATLPEEHERPPGSLTDESDGNHQHNTVNQVDYQAEDDHYQEINSTYHIPTKSGDEDNAHLDSDRPGSAGTSRSGGINEDDKAVLALNAAPAIRPTPPPPTGGMLFRKSTSEDDDDEPQQFMFAAATKPKLNFDRANTKPLMSAGQPKAIGAGAEPAHEQPTSNAGAVTKIEQRASAAHDAATVPLDVPLTDPGTNGNLRPPREANSEPNRKMKKRKGGKKKAKTVTRQPPPDHPVHQTADEGEAINDRICEEDAVQRAGNHHFETAAHGVSCATQENMQGPGPPLDADRHSKETASRISDVAQEDVQRPGSPLFLENDCAPEKEPNLLHREPHGDPQSDGPETTVEDVIGAQQEEPVQDSATPLPPAAYGPDFSLVQRNGHVMGAHSDNALHNVSDTHGLARVKKKKKKSKVPQGSMPPTRSRPTSSTAPKASIDDYMKILRYKIEQQNQAALEDAIADRNSVQEELQEVLEARQSVQDELDNMLQQNDELTSTFEQQKAKLAKYEIKFASFNNFISGLGRDFNTLKKEAARSRNEGEQLMSESLERNRERATLSKTIEDCLERSAKLRHQTLKHCSETERDLQIATQRADDLEVQLSEKVGLLVEERDRRSDLEKKLMSTLEPSEAVSRLVRDGNDALLEKLDLVHSILGQRTCDDKTSTTLEQTLEAMQALSSRTDVSMEDAATTKGLVETLHDRLSQWEKKDSHQPLQEQLDEVLQNLRGLADDQMERTRQSVAHREAVENLQEQLKSCNVQITQKDQEVSQALERESKLKDDNEQLQTDVANLQNERATAAGAGIGADGVSTELNATTKALEAARTDISNKAAELRAQTNTTEELKGRLQELSNKVQELEQASRELVPEQEARERKIRDEAHQAHQNLVKSSADYRAELEMESSNLVKKITSERDRFKNQVTPLQLELTKTKQRNEELEITISNGVQAGSEQLRKSEDIVRSQKLEIEALNTSLRHSEQSADTVATLEKQLIGLSDQLKVEQTKLQTARQERKALEQQIDKHRHDSDEARESADRLRDELASTHVEKDKRVATLETERNEARESARRSEAGLELYKQSSATAAEEQQAKTWRQIEGLQTDLAQQRADNAEKGVAHEKFRTEVDEMWQTTSAGLNDKLNEQKALVARRTGERDAIQKDNDRLSRALDESRTQLELINKSKPSAALTSDTQQAQQNVTTAFHESGQRMKVPSLSEGLLRPAVVQTTEPTKLRKKVDRSQYAEHHGTMGPPVDASSSHDAKGKRGPTVEDSQLPEEGQERPPITRAGVPSVAGVSDLEEMLDTGLKSQSGSQQETQFVAETQFSHPLQSFADFHRNTPGLHVPRANPLTSSPLSTSQHMSSDADQRASSKAVSQVNNTHAGTARRSQSDFQIYEDTKLSQSQASQNSDIYATAHLQDSLTWTPEEREKYTYRKPFAQPNSASKLVRAPSNVSSVGTNRVEMGTQRKPLRERSLGTPRLSPGVRSEHSAARSSSPAYTQPTSTHPRRTYSNTQKASGQRQSSVRAQSIPTQDPRLIGRTPSQAPKRKSDGVVEGYEQERKKRLQTTESSATDARRFSLRSQSQQSIRDLPRFPTVSMKQGSSYGNGSQSRMRTLAGGNTRGSGSKRVAKNDDINARFSQELGGQ